MEYLKMIFKTRILSNFLLLNFFKYYALPSPQPARQYRTKVVGFEKSVEYKASIVGHVVG